MMKINKCIPIALMAMGLCTGLTSCGEESDALTIICLDAGYGVSWIEKVKDQFVEANPGVNVDVKTYYEANELITQHLASRKNKDDLYIAVGATWKENAAQGKFADLTDFLEETVDGVKVKEKVADEYKQSIYYTDDDGSQKCYRLPFTSGVGGIFYNEAMFENYGWKTYLRDKYESNTTGLPETFEQLEDICAKINADRKAVPGDYSGSKAVKPFIYGGRDTDYFDYTVFNWWGQIAGKENINEFLKYQSYENFDVTKNDTYAALKTATSYWNKLFKSENYVADQNNTSAADAQKLFVNGYAAMMFNGDWLYNETLEYNASSDSFKLGLMKTPTLPETKEEYKNTSYIIGEDQYIAIPETAPHKDLAKAFIKTMISDKGCETFINEAHGFLAYNANYASLNVQDQFMQQSIALRNSFSDKFTNFSPDRKYLINAVDVWTESSQRPFLEILKGTKTLDSAFLDIARNAENNWSKWTNLANK